MSTDPTSIPVAYFITFRTYGTWLHGDPRGSVDRATAVYGAPRIDEKNAWVVYERFRSKQPSVRLSAHQRAAVRFAVEDTIRWRGWTLRALNVRTNHVHTVVTTGVKPERALNALKANATRVLRQLSLWESPRTPWADGGSTRYLWDDHAVAMAVHYVLHRQGVALPEWKSNL